MKKILVLLAGILCVSVFFAGREGDIKIELPPESVTKEIVSYDKIEIETFDSSKNPVRIYFDKVPTRVLVYEVNPLETLLAFGQGDKILSASLNTSGETYARLKEKYPEELKKIRQISQQEITREQAIAYRPDFILGWKSTFSPRRYGSTEWWQERGVNTYIVATSNHVLKYGTIEDECKFLDDMGRIFDVQEQADAVIHAIYAELEMESAHIDETEPQDVVVVEVDGNEMMNYDEGWIVGDMVRRLGGRMPLTSRSAGAEELLQQNPDVIFAVCFNERHRQESEAFFRHVRFNSLQAVRNNRVYMIPFGYIYTPGIKTLDGLRAIKKGLYPDR